MKATLEGIMYPVGAKELVLSRNLTSSGHCSDHYIEIPHCAWERGQKLYDMAFSKALGIPQARTIFVLGPLHKGPVCFDDRPMVYSPEGSVLAGSGWELGLTVPDGISDLVQRSDDICSEEASLEVAAPYLCALFPKAKVCWLLATGSCPEVTGIVDFALKDYPFSLILLSNNSEENCAHMWKEALER